jgi:glutathione S-transferase
VKLNPKSKVPTLQKDDGSVLTEFPAIATWLARKNPTRSLLPADADGEARALEAMDYVVSTMHMQGFSRMFRPRNYAADRSRTRQGEGARQGDHGEGLALMDKALEGKEVPHRQVLGGRCGALLCRVLGAGRMKMPLPKNVARPLRSA